MNPSRRALFGLAPSPPATSPAGEPRPPTRDELPVLHEALLDEVGLEAVLADIAAHTAEVAAQIRVGGRSEPVGFALAAARFREGQLRALQVQYRYDGRLWRDTLLRTPAGTKLIRSQNDQ